MSKQYAWTTYGYVYYQDKKYRSLSLPINKDIKESYKNFTVKYDLSRYGVQSTSAPWKDRDYNFKIEGDKLYFHSLILKTNMARETLKAKLYEDGIKVWNIEKEGINILSEFYNEEDIFVYWFNGVVKIVLSQKIANDIEVFNELHFTIENGSIIKTEEIVKEYKTFASCVEE